VTANITNTFNSLHSSLGEKPTNIADIQSNADLALAVNGLATQLPEQMVVEADNCHVTSDLDEVARVAGQYVNDASAKARWMLVDVQPNPNMAAQRTLVCFVASNTNAKNAMAHITDGSRVDNPVINALKQCEGLTVINTNFEKANSSGSRVGMFGNNFAGAAVLVVSRTIEEAAVDKMGPMAIQKGIVPKPTPQAAQ
jgi:hypothetical protein